jgi:SHS family lactate transporter-like MFS transporter
MTAAVATAKPIPWWKEPTKDQWLAWVAAWLGWTLDSFDFTIFLLVMLPISQEFNVPLTDVAIIFTVTLWMRLLGAVSSGWLADRVGRKLPLMISISWYSLCNFIAGFSPTFWFLFLFRALLGFGMGAEWPAGAALAMEQWPIRSRGFMSGVLQGSWGIGFLLSSAAYGLLYTTIGWRGLFWLGVLPALTVVYVRYFVKEPPVWLENRRRQRAEKREVRTPLFSIFKRGMLVNTLLACWWMAGGMVTYYSINAMFATHLQKDLGLSPAMIATPIVFANLLVFLASGVWGVLGDRIGRRWAMIIPGLLGIPVAFWYMLSGNYWVIVIGYVLQGALLGGGAGAHVPSLMNERFPTEVRATASAFCYHQATIWGGLVPPLITYFATNYDLGFSIPMLVGCVLGGASWCLALFLGPETKGKEMVPDLVLA